MSGLAVGLRSIFRRFTVLPILLLSARYHCYRLNSGAAKERLLRATRLVPACFKAHLRLGAIYLEEHDFSRAKQEFLLARELNPAKFRRLYPLITGQSGDININLFYFPGFTDRVTDESPADFLREFIGEPLGDGIGDRPDEPVRWGDFSSYREFRKFQEMGPFRREEVEAVDWDGLSRLFDEE